MLSTDGDTALGGEDIDALVVTHLATRFEVAMSFRVLWCLGNLNLVYYFPPGLQDFEVNS